MIFECPPSLDFIHSRPTSVSDRFYITKSRSNKMQLPVPEDSRLRFIYASTTSTHEFDILRIRSTYDVLVKMDNRPRDASWKDAFWTMAETSLQEAEDLMISLPYTQIRQQIYRLAPALEVVRVANLVRATSGDPSSVLVDIDLKNTIAREHHKYATTNLGSPNRGVVVLPSPYSSSHGGSRLEIVKTELQATPKDRLSEDILT
jgi:hypothetical protein